MTRCKPIAFLPDVSLIKGGTAVEPRQSPASKFPKTFNRGQRAIFFALGYLGWFIGPLPLITTTAGILIVMWRRQFSSLSHEAVTEA